MQFFLRFPFVTVNGSSTSSEVDDARLLTSSALKSKDSFGPATSISCEETDTSYFEAPANLAHVQPACTTAKSPSRPTSPRSAMPNVDMIRNDRSSGCTKQHTLDSAAATTSTADSAPHYAAAVVNKDDELEHLLEIGDIDNLLLEFGSRRENDGVTSPRVGQALLYIGMYNMRQGDNRSACHCFKKASQCGITNGDNGEVRVEAGFIQAEAQYHMGNVKLAIGDNSGAENCFAKALYLHQANESEHDRDPQTAVIVARCLHTLGVMYTRTGKFDVSLYTLQLCAKICEQCEVTLESRELLGNALYWIGNVHLLTDNSEAAVVYRKAALRVKAEAC